MEEIIKLLLVEDDANLCYIIQGGLEDMIGGYKVLTASNGEEGLAVWKAQQPDVIVADIEMPVMDGYEMVRRIREQDEHVPILFTSGRVSPKDVVKGYELGVNNYVKKPFLAEELHAHITALLKLTRGMSAQKEVREVPIGKLFSFDTVRGVWKQKGGEERMLTAREADLLRPYEGVIAAETGHINQHEAGAVEAGGHKVLALPHHEGKLDAAEVDRYVTAFYQDPSWDHMVAPGMVYISHPTEYGTLYTLDELKDLSAVCRKHKIPLFLDGARLGYGLAARDTDVTLKDIASLCDIFYIGGTKVGALFGEAVVIPQPGLIRQFDTIVKQRGVLLAKGRLLGLQFDTLFTDGLYLKIARHAIDMADRIVEGLKANGYTFYIRPQSNQLFVQLENSLYEKLAQRIGFEVWEKRADGTTVVRIATSWATREEDVAELLEELKNK